MNPTMVVCAMLRRYPLTTLIFILVIAVAVALGVGITAQERALRQGSAMAADRFGLLVAAPGSQQEIVFNTIFLQPSAVPLLDPEVVSRVLTDARAKFAAPIGYGDNVQGLQVVGTIAAFIDQLSDGVSEGRLFEREGEAIIGAGVPFAIGDVLKPSHGSIAMADGGEEAEEGHGHYDLEVVGRMRPTGNPWDRAVVVPIENIWEVHGLPNGHAEGDERIGPPFDPDRVPGLPAIVMQGNTFADMYGLRSEYRTDRSMAFFPAEVLFQLYELLGNVRQVMSVMAVVTQALAFLSIFAGVFALMKLFERQFAVLRALGASRLYVFASVWLFASTIILTGVALGTGFGFAVAEVASRIIARASGVTLSASLGSDEVMLAAGGAALGLVFALAPAGLLYRGSVAEMLR